MKKRLSYFLLLLILIISIVTSIYIWRSHNLKQIPTFHQNPYNSPISSKYIPINSDIVFHWKINPTLIPKYIENYQDQFNKNLTNNNINFLRDSAFKLLGLDFVKDVSNWSGDYGSFAVLNTNKQLLNDWIMVLGTKDDINLEEELEYISDSNVVDNNTNSINSLSSLETEIVSKKINSNQYIYFAKENNNILIASKPTIIKSSLEESNRNTLKAKAKYKYIQIKDNLNDGFLLLEISPKKIFNIIGQKEKILSLNDAKNLISSINIDKNILNIEGILSFDVKSEMPAKNIDYNFIDLIKKSKLYEDFILVDNPNQYFKKDPSQPYKKLISSLIRESAASDYSNLFKIILENSNGNFLWINDKDWLILTKKYNTSKKEISDVLKQDNFLNSNLDFEDKKLEIWSKISIDGNDKYKIKENIEAIIYEDEKTYLWSQNLSSISKLNDKSYLENNSDRKNEVDNINDFEDILQIHLGEEKTKKFLNNFYPYILFKTMLGNKLAPPKNIDISIAVPKINYPDFIKFKIKLISSL